MFVNPWLQSRPPRSSGTEDYGAIVLARGGGRCGGACVGTLAPAMATDPYAFLTTARADLLARFELRAEDFDARGGHYPAWTLLLLPSFGHEVFLRASRDADGPAVRLVTLQTSLGHWLGFTLEAHLYATIRGTPRPPPGVRYDVRERCDEARWSCFAEEMAALDAPALGDVRPLGLDGCTGFATAVESPTRRGAFKAWSPAGGSPHGRFWEALLGLARQTLLDERSQRTLDLVGGDAIACIEGATPIVRVGRPLTDLAAARLQATLDGLGGRRALVDLRPLAPCGPIAERYMEALRWPAEVLWVVPPVLVRHLARYLDAGRCVASLEEASARLHGGQ